MKIVAALYQFMNIDDEEAHRVVDRMKDVMHKYDVRGNVRVAKEGVFFIIFFCVRRRFRKKTTTTLTRC